MTTPETPDEQDPQLSEFAPEEPDGFFIRDDGSSTDENGAEPKSNLAELIEAVLPQYESNATSFARWMGIPERADYLRPVLDAFNSRLPLIEAIARIESLPLPAMLYENGLALALESLSREWRFLICLRDSGHIADPTHGVQSKHPFYAMHPYHPGPQNSRSAYDLLQAQVIAGALTCWDESEDNYRHGVITALADAAVSVRTCVSFPVVGHLPAQPVSREDYVSALRKVQDQPEVHGDSKNSQAHIGRILKFFEKLADDEDDDYVELAPPKVTFSPKRDGVRFRWSIRRTTNALTPSEKKRIAYSGLAPDEITSDVEYVVFEPDREAPKPTRIPNTPPSLVVQVHVREHLIAAIERANQNLPLSWNRLLPDEIAIFLHQATNEAVEHVGGFRRWARESVPRETAALLMAMFWLSRPLESCLDLVVIPSLAAMAGDRPHNKPAYIAKEKLWCLPAARPKAAPSYAGAARELAEPTSDHVLLPVPAAIIPILDNLPTVLRMNNESSPAFVEDHTELRLRALDVIRVIAKNNPRRTSEARLEQAVFWAIAEKSGDIATASLCLGRTHRSSDTALHYACQDRDTIATMYSSVCAEMISEAKLELAHLGLGQPKTETTPSPGLPKIESTIEGTVGVPICPTPSTVQRLRRDIKEAFKKIAAKPGAPGFLIEHHNLLTLYTVHLMKVATGYRDIKSPLPRREDIDFDDNTILISDKDDLASFGTRIIPLVEPLRQQLIYYDEHARTLASRVALSDPKLAADLFRQFGLSNDTVPDQLQKAAQAGSKGNKPETIKAAPPLFFLFEKGNRLSFEEVRPKRLTEELAMRAPWFHLPTNLNRSYLRRQLGLPSSNELKTPPADHESVSFLLSHWTRGREPLGQFATRPLDAYLHDLAPRLTEIAFRDGWVAMKGLS